MSKDRDWRKVFHKRFVQHHYGADDFYGFHGYGSKEVDLVIGFIEEEIDRQLEISAKDTNTLYEMMKKKVENEKKKSYVEGRKEVLEEVKKKFPGVIRLGVDVDGNILQMFKPDLSIWLDKELDKLKEEDNGRIRTNGENVS